jgi:hypothetical protein
LAALFSVALGAAAIYPQASSSSAGTAAGSSSNAGSSEEFPLWARDLRRAEIVTFGSFPFTFYLATFAMDSYRYFRNDMNSLYAPWPMKPAGAIEMNTDEYVITIAAAFGGAVLVAVADHIIVRLKRNKAREDAARLAPGEPIIIRRPWPPEEDFGAGPGP